jgi:hypothetical protein
MTGKGKLLLGLTVVFLVGAVLGVVGGGYGGYRLGTSRILNECLVKDAKAVRSHAVTLKHLRAGEGDRAVELLEAHLDDDLIVFDPWEPYRGLTGETISEIKKAIHESKEYRLAHPRKSDRPHVDKMVKNVFSRELYK